MAAVLEGFPLVGGGDESQSGVFVKFLNSHLMVAIDPIFCSFVVVRVSLFSL